MDSKTKIDLKDLKNRLKEDISKDEILSRYNYSEGLGRGTMLDCPFCGSKKKLWKSSKGNFFRCFGHCDNGLNGSVYDIFNFYELANGKNQYFNQTICMVAKDFGYISSEDADRIMKSYSKNKSNSIEVNKDVLREYKERVVAEKELLTQDIQIVSNVYEEISQISKLTKSQIKYLKNVRKLDEPRIQKDYFNMPFMYRDHGKNFMVKLLENLNKKYGYVEKDLLGVPGFFLNTETQEVSFIASKGIGMKSRLASNIIAGVQIRTYDKIDSDGNLTAQKDAPKYIWLSSSQREMGAYSTSPVDILIPDNLAYTSLFITEGKFKAEIVSKEFKSICLSIPGVNQWDGKIIPEIDYIDSNIKHINNIYIAFDADMGCNLKVYNSFKKMTSELMKDYKDKNFEILIWDEAFGKGLDDLILSNNKDKLSKVKFNEYVLAYENFLKVLEKEYDVSPLDIRYKNSNIRVDKKELSQIYREEVLINLNISTKNSLAYSLS